jgi:hypothetical protein
MKRDVNVFPTFLSLMQNSCASEVIGRLVEGGADTTDTIVEAEKTNADRLEQFDMWLFRTK